MKDKFLIFLAFLSLSSVFCLFARQAPSAFTPGEEGVVSGEIGSGTPAAAKALLADSLLLRADSLSRAADSLRSQAGSLLGHAAKSPAAAKAAAAKKAKPWEGSFGLGLTFNRGNSRQESFVSTLEVERKGVKTRLSSSSSVTRTSSSEGGESDKGTFKTKLELDQSRHFFYFASLDLDYNRQAGIDLRLAPGLGVGISAVFSGKCRLNFNLGANPVTEYLKDRPNHTRGHYLAGEDLRWTLNGRTRLDQSLVWKPRIDKTESYLLNINLSLTNKLTTNFDLKLNLEGRYNSRPPLRSPPIRRQDWMFYTAVSYSIW